MVKSRKIKKHPQPYEASLSVVIPAYNSEKWISPTLEYLNKALKQSRWRNIEIIVVDDGSKDKTTKIAKSVRIDYPVKVLRQRNAGRLIAREKGILRAKGYYCLLLDSRIVISPKALSYLQSQMAKNPKAVVWNGHVNMDREGNPFARFWYAITFLAWRRYMKNPRLIHYGEKDFDYYPKGTTGFFAPRAYLLEAYKQFKTSYDDPKHANDDTSLLRYITKFTDIYMSPGYSLTYISRSTLRAFIPHTLHRGVVFIDGHFHRGSRYFYATLMYLLLAPIMLVLVILMPELLFLAAPLLLSVFLFAKMLGAETADAAALAYVMPVFAFFYTAGLYKGLLLRVTSNKN